MSWRVDMVHLQDATTADLQRALRELPQADGRRRAMQAELARRGEPVAQPQRERRRSIEDDLPESAWRTDR